MKYIWKYKYVVLRMWVRPDVILFSFYKLAGRLSPGIVAYNTIHFIYKLGGELHVTTNTPCGCCCSWRWSEGRSWARQKRPRSECVMRRKNTHVMPTPSLWGGRTKSGTSFNEAAAAAAAMIVMMETVWPCRLLLLQTLCDSSLSSQQQCVEVVPWWLQLLVHSCRVFIVFYFVLLLFLLTVVPVVVSLEVHSLVSAKTPRLLVVKS